MNGIDLAQGFNKNNGFCSWKQRIPDAHVSDGGWAGIGALNNVTKMHGSIRKNKRLE